MPNGKDADFLPHGNETVEGDVTGPPVGNHQFTETLLYGPSYFGVLLKYGERI